MLFVTLRVRVWIEMPEATEAVIIAGSHPPCEGVD